MTKDEIISMARDAGLPDPMVFSIAYQSFAALVAAKEREECAKVCCMARSNIWEYHDETVKETAHNVCTNLAAAIRARGEIKGCGE